MNLQSMVDLPEIYMTCRSTNLPYADLLGLVDLQLPPISGLPVPLGPTSGLLSPLGHLR